MSPPKPLRPSRRHGFYVWHRYMGLVSAAFVVMLSITGVMLNHTESLALHSRHLQSDQLLDWYGISAGPALVSYAAGTHWISEVGGRIYFDEQEILNEPQPLVGALALEGFVVAATSSQLLLLTPQGEMMEHLSREHGVPAGIQRIGKDDAGQLIIHTATGDYRADQNVTTWQSSPLRAQVVWAQHEITPKGLRHALTRAYRGTGLSFERVVLDIHSGRIVGTWGVYLMDVMAALFILLAAMGIWMWASRK